MTPATLGLAAILSIGFSFIDLVLLTLIFWRVMGTTPVSQATFDTALTQLNAAFTTLLNAVQSVETGLTAVEAALTAAQQNPGSTDFSGELATVQNLQAEVSAAQATATAAIESLPTSTSTTGNVKSSGIAK